jgi:hypothetical protein
MKQVLIVPLAVATLAAASAAYAFDSSIPQAGLPTAPQYSASLLPEAAGVVPWRTLAKVEPVTRDGRIVPVFDKEVLGLDQRKIKIQGFILPMDLGEKQKHFLVSAVPPHCPFCLPAGPDAVVEVLASKPVPYGFEPVVIEGKLAVLKDDPSGVFYRMTDAQPVAREARRSTGPELAP